MGTTCNLKVCTGTDAETESAGDADNWNLMSTDEYDSTGTEYQTDKISVPDSGTNYSYERWLRLEFTGTFNLIENVKAWHSAGSLSDGNLDLLAGETDTGVTPVNTVSSVATTTLTSWDSEGEAIDITPTADIDTSGDETDYLVIQLEVPDTVTTPGDIGSQTITFSYDES
jgi:hypothetical protein